MKSLLLFLFRKNPISTGLLLFLILFHITGIKDLRTPLAKTPEFPVTILFFFVISLTLFMAFVLNKIDKNKQEKTVWLIIGVGVIILTVVTKICTL